MKRLHIFIITALLHFTSAFAQMETYAYFEMPLYIIHENEVIYQDAAGRKIIHPDLSTFRLLDLNEEMGMAVDKNGIYFKGVFLAVDTCGIEIVGRNNERPVQWLWKTNTQVFNNTQELHGIDAASFSATECLNGGYFKDKNYIYYFDQKMDHSDGKTVNTTCDFELCYDATQVYLRGEIMQFNGEIVRPLTTALFRTKTAVIDRHANIITTADPKTIKPLSERYAIDKNHLFLDADTVLIPPASLKNIRVWDQPNNLFYSDGQSIYASNGILQKNLDEASFGVLPQSTIFYDKNGCYRHQWDAEKQVSFNEKLAFNYGSAFSAEKLSRTDYYLVYDTDVYSWHTKEFHYNLSAEELQHVRTNHLLAADSIALIRHPAYVDENTYFPNTPFILSETHILSGEKVLIGTENLQLLAIFSGYRPGCGSDPLPYTNLYFFKNNVGYWLIETVDDKAPQFLGPVFNKEWNPIFSDFELN